MEDSVVRQTVLNHSIQNQPSRLDTVIIVKIVKLIQQYFRLRVGKILQNVTLQYLIEITLAPIVIVFSSILT